MSTRRGLVPAKLTARYTQLKVELNAAIEAKPLDWAACADAEEQLEAVCGEIAIALHRVDQHVLASIVSDRAWDYRREACESRKQAAQRAGDVR